MLLKNVIDDFIRYMGSIDRSKETIIGYGKELRYFNDYITQKYNSLVYLEEIDLKDLEDYMYYLKERGNQSASRSRVVYILRSFYNYADRNDLCVRNYARLLETVKIKQKDPEYLTEKEFNEFIEVIDHQLIRTIVETMFYTGLRISEITSLTLEDVDMKKKIVQVIAGKGNKDRVIPICDKLYDILLEYISNIRPDVTGDNFFCTEKTGSISPAHINRVIKEATEKLDWTRGRDISAHSFRHSFSSNLVAKGASLPSVQRLLGHQNLAVTSRYVHQDMSQLTADINLL